MFFSAECLIDSGRPVNFIKHKLISPLNINIKDKCSELTYFGLNKTKLIILGKIECFIKINDKKINFEFLVVANDSMGYDAVLGRNFMRKSEIVLAFKNDTIKLCKEDKNNEMSNIMRKLFEKKIILCENDRISFKKCSDATECADNIEMTNRDKNENWNDIFLINCEENHFTDNLCLSDRIEAVHRQKFYDLFEKYFINFVSLKEPRVKGEMKLFIQNPRPFHFPVRRLSFYEKNELQNLLDEYLQKGFIRHSSSEYASAIVLVKKNRRLKNVYGL